MGYIGSQPATNFETVRKQVSTTNSGTTITLDYSVSSVQDILVTVNAVVQSYDNYSVSGTTLTLGGTLNNDRVEILYVGRTFQTVTPAVGTVTNEMLSGSIANSKLANSSITLNGSSVSLGGSASVDNTPSFLVNISSAQSIPTSSVTKIQFDTEVFDTDSAFNTGSYRFTPQVAGKYVIGMHVSLSTSDDFDQNFVQINKNGSNVFQSYYENKYYNGHSGETVIVLNGSTDYVDFYIHQSRGGATDLRPDTFCTFAYGYKLIGV